MPVLASRFGNELYGYLLASVIGYELCGWPVAFLRHMELDMSYEAG